MWAWNSSPFRTHDVCRNILDKATDMKWVIDHACHRNAHKSPAWRVQQTSSNHDSQRAEATHFFGCHACWSLAKIRCTWPHNSWRNWQTSILFRCWIVTSGWWNLMVPLLELLNSTFPLRDSPLDQLSFSPIRGGHWALSKLCCLAGWLVPHHVA